MSKRAFLLSDCRIMKISGKNQSMSQSLIIEIATKERKTLEFKTLPSAFFQNLPEVSLGRLMMQ